MRSYSALFLTVVACTNPSPTRLTVDVSRLGLTKAPVQSVGLLVVNAPLSDATAQQTRAESDEGATISTSAPEPTQGGAVTIGETRPDMKTGVRAADAPSGSTTASVATPEVEKSDGARAPFAYFPIDLEQGSTSFTVDVPSGPNQSLFLYGFGPPATEGGTPIPNYAAAAVNVALEAGAEQDITFVTYPAGVIAPQILTPSLIGLVDANGTRITAVPEDLSCLAVAHAVAAREGFPTDLTVKIRVGSLSSASAVGNASVMVVPVGDYKISCFAQFANKLFAVNPPIDVTVEQGKVSVATGALMKIKDLTPLINNVTVDPTVVPGTMVEPGTTPAGEISVEPRFSVHLGEGGLISRQTQLSGTAVAPSTQSNFDNRSGDTTISVLARNADGTFNSAYNGVVVLRVTPALDATLVGNELGGGVWKPFAGATPHEQRLFIVDGVGGLQNGLRLSSLVVPVVGDRATMQFVLTVQPFDNAGGVARVAGAKLFTVRSDLGCRTPLPFASWFGSTLTAIQNELSIAFDSASGSYTAQSEHMIIGALTAQTGANTPSRCVFTPQATDGNATLVLIPLNQESRDLLLLSPAFVKTSFPALMSDGFSLKLPVTASGETVLFDAIAPMTPKPGSNVPVGTRFKDLGYSVFDGSIGVVAMPPQLKLTAVVK